MVFIRAETADDYPRIREVNERAFGRGNEADLVELLRADSAFIPELSLVALEEISIVGHCLLSRTSIEGSPDDNRILALGPIAVLPDFQRRGIGSSLMNHGLRVAESHGFRGVVLTGHPEYYPRFGFRPGADFGLTCEFEVPREVFMALPFVPEGFPGVTGRILFAPPFKLV